MHKKSLIGTFVLVLLTGVMAHASVIVSQPPDQSGGSDMNAFLEADTFTIAPASVEWRQLTFWALQSSPADYTGSIDWAFYSDLSGAPNTSLFSGNASPVGTVTGNTALGLNEYVYTLPIDVTLGTGTYWLVLHNGPSGTVPATSFYWEWSNGSAGNSVSWDIAGGGPWAGNSAALAFQLSDAPEPVSTSLVGGGLLAAWLLRRRMKGMRG